MEKCEFNIEQRRTKELPLWIINYILFIIGSMLWIPTNDIQYFIYFMFLWIIISYFILHIFPYLNLVGKLVFTYDQIEINKKHELIVIPFNEIEEFRIDYTGKKSFYYRRIDLGNNNKVKIKSDTGLHEYYLCIRNKNEERRLNSLMINLYEKGINISETVNDMKTYGLKCLKYNDVQLFKKMYLNKSNHSKQD